MKRDVQDVAESGGRMHGRSAEALIRGSGEMADAFRAHDWSRTSLGPVASWSETLLGAVNSMLHSPFASVLFWGAELLLLYNDGYRAFLAGKHPAALGRPAIASWEEVWDAVGASLYSTLREGTILNVENQMIPILIDGRMEDRYWKFCFYPLYERGRIVAVNQIAFDSTSEVTAARKLQENEGRLRLALAAANGIGTWDWDVQRDIVHADENFARLYGVDPRLAATGAAIAEFTRNVHVEDRPRVEEQIERALRDGEFVSEYRLRQPDGTSRWVLAVGRCSHDDAGAPVRFPGVSLDITERKLSEDALGASKTRFRSALETARLGTWELEIASGGRRLESSATCKANYGRSADERFTYEDMMATVHPDDRAEMRAAAESAIANGTVYRAEYRVVWPDGSVHWIVASGGMTYSVAGEGEIMVGVSLDVTERHLAAAALMQSEKLAAVGRLASSIAHEINNPLESVTNLLFLAQGSTSLLEIQEHLMLADRELRRVSAICSQTLRFHKQATSPQAVSCLELIQSVLSVYQARLVNSGMQLEKRMRAMKTVLCFEGEIRQVLSNLIGNAIDAMPDGGRLLVRSREGTNWSTGEQGLILTVADTGQGMPPEVRKKIFEPFFTTKGIVGNGLGLWVSQEIVTRHRGALRVRSSQRLRHCGTVFSLFLPFAAASR